MYYNRTLSTEEELYISKAQQKIAELTVIMAEESSRNDVDDYNAELVTELQYSIHVLKSTFLDWTPDEIREMMDYYTLKGGLVDFVFRSISFDPTHLVNQNTIWATVPQLREVETNSIDYDAYLLSLINKEIVDRTDYDAYLLNLINTSSSGGVLTVEVTSEISLGGIKQGDIFPIGTSLEDIWIKLLSIPAVVTDFTFDSFSSVIEVNSNMTITQFTWAIEGSPVNLQITDSKGLLTQEPVTGVSYNVNLGYNWSIPETLTWTLAGDNVEDVTITVDRVYGSYFGKEATANDDPVTVTEAKILASNKSVVKTADNITLSVSTSVNEQGFIAVPKVQTVTSYTKWTVDNTNTSNILTGEFIRPPVNVIVNGVVYEVYRWGYKSPLIGNLTLHR